MPIKNLVAYKTLGSTNDAARLYEPGTCVVSQEQSSGRGRHGKTWLSPIGGLYFSYVFKNNTNANSGLLSIIAGIALHRILILESKEKELNKENLCIKWPNDIIEIIRISENTLEQRKIAGILIEKTSDDKFILGIGINLCEADLLNNCDQKAGFMSLHDNSLDKTFILCSVISEFMEILETWDFQKISEYWNINSAYKFNSVVTFTSSSFEQKNITKTGRVRELDSDGSLLIEDSVTGENISLSSGEVNGLRQVLE